MTPPPPPPPKLIRTGPPPPPPPRNAAPRAAVPPPTPRRAPPPPVARKHDPAPRPGAVCECCKRPAKARYFVGLVAGRRYFVNREPVDRPTPVDVCSRACAVELSNGDGIEVVS